MGSAYLGIRKTIMDKTKVNKGKKACRNIYTCDQGHYGSTTCSLCEKDVSERYKECPYCGATFSLEDNYDYNRGGSDF
jgi:hypothetical protein